MRLRRAVLLLALALAVIGVVIISTSPSTKQLVTMPTDRALIIGDNTAFAADSEWVTRAVIGYGLVWVATLLVAVVLGHWLAARRSASA